MFIYKKDGKIMASSENERDYSEFGWQIEETDEEIVQIKGLLYKASEAPQPTAEELAETEIARLKQYLADTDYIVFKIAEGAATTDEYIDVIRQRQEARAKINKLQTEKE